MLLMINECSAVGPGRRSRVPLHSPTLPRPALGECSFAQFVASQYFDEGLFHRKMLPFGELFHQSSMLLLRVPAAMMPCMSGDQAHGGGRSEVRCGPSHARRKNVQGSSRFH